MAGADRNKGRVLFKKLFDAIDIDSDGSITKHDIIQRLQQSGFQKDDVRVADIYKNLSQYDNHQEISLKIFTDMTRKNIFIIKNAFEGNLVIPDFTEFCQNVERFYNEVKSISEGKVADYIPQLAKVEPNKFAVSICTIDGQQFHLGDYRDQFCLQSVCKPLLYCLALEDNGEEVVHSHIGREPSGASFNEIKLNSKGLPHNPMINAGAIMNCALIKSHMDIADRFEYVMDVLKLLAGGGYIGFDNAVYLSEREHADRNFALGYFMRENKAFPKDADLIKSLEFYFQSCSIKTSCKNLSVIAASLANAGTCPMTDASVFQPSTVKNCLSLMYSCGMYDYSGEWAFLVGLPAKSGISGGIMVVVPDVLGICIWSPPLDALGNSVRGLAFFKKFIDYYNFHNYDSLIKVRKKVDPRYKKQEFSRNNTFALLSAASEGDLDEVVRLTAAGVNLNASDYDGRTALHLAASNGHKDVVGYLINRGVKLDALDRWRGSPLDDAMREGYNDIVKMLQRG